MEQHVLALGEALAQRLADILPTRLESVEEGALDLGPKVSRSRPDRHGADQTRVVAPPRHELLDVVAGHEHVAVRHDDPRVAGGIPALQHIVELGVAAPALLANEQLGLHMRMFLHQAIDEPGDRIVAPLQAEDDLVFRVVEREGRGERLTFVVVDAAERADAGDRRGAGRCRKRARALPAPYGADRHARQIEPGREQAEGGGTGGWCHLAFNSDSGGAARTYGQAKRGSFR